MIMEETKRQYDEKSTTRFQIVGWFSKRFQQVTYFVVDTYLPVCSEEYYVGQENCLEDAEMLLKSKVRLDRTGL